MRKQILIFSLVALGLILAGCGNTNLPTANTNLPANTNSTTNANTNNGVVANINAEINVNLNPTPEANVNESVGMANPASVNCQVNGGKSEIVTAADGSQSGVCKFTDGSQCDEWAFYRGECQPKDKNSLKTFPFIAGPTNVSIENMAFNPATLTLKVGANVTFTNNDSVSHQIASDSKLLNSGVLLKGNAFTTTFDKKGTYDYHCSIHPTMKGTIIIE